MTTTLSESEVRRIAELARLDLTSDEIALFTPQLARILEYVEQIRGLDTAGVSPTTHVVNRPMDRPDEPGATLSRRDVLSNAPDAAPEAGLFKVPRVLG
ncbi:MAG: Asp-tRNA(Asn)/Glu-tRNA(Gln) amidotransferase subunit GatC [Acidobacteriota bacterium]